MNDFGSGELLWQQGDPQQVGQSSCQTHSVGTTTPQIKGTPSNLTILKISDPLLHHSSSRAYFLTI